MSPARQGLSGYLVLASGNAGSADEQAIRQAIEVLATDAPTELCRTEEPEDLEDALAGLAGRRLVIAGGDGSVHLVVNSLLARGDAASTPVGLVPLGTGNDLAHGLGLPLDAARAAGRIVGGEARALDVLRGAEDVAVNAAHVGLGVAAVRGAQRLKPVLGVLGYRLAAVWTGAVLQGVKATVAVEGRCICESEPVLLVAVMNGSSIGGGTPLCPSADPADGLLDVVVVTDRARAKRAAFGLALTRGQHLGLPGVTHGQGRQVSVRMTEGTWNVDGELIAGPAQLQWETQPAAWQIVT